MKLTYSEIAGLCRSLALLLHAGIGTADGVFLLAEEESKKMRPLLTGLGAKMDGGRTLSEAMKESDAFPGCVTGMVAMGEQTGRLEEVLSALAAFYDQRDRSSRQIRQALTCPTMILVLMIVVISVLLIKVLPVFDAVYASLGSRLTGVAAGLLHLGQLLKNAMPLLLVILAVVVLAALVYIYCAPIKEKVNAWWTARFGDRGASRKFNNANFARALAMGLSSALPLEDAVEQAAMLLSDIPGAAERCRRCAQSLRSGSALADAMKESGFLPPAESRMLSVGLRQGSGDRVMADIADRLQEDAQESLERTVAKVEPAMVLVASALVGLILLSVMLPLMNIMAAIG